MVPQVLINLFGIRLTARLNDFSVWWHIGGVVLIAGLLTFLGTHHNSAGFLFQHVTATSPLEASSADFGGGRMAPALVVADLKVPSPLFALVPGLAALYAAAPLGLVFVLALLQAQWTYTGYDASAHVAEETVLARLTLLKRVGARRRTPTWAILVTCVLAVLITVYAAAYSVVTSISTITLYLAYVIPICLNWRNRRRGLGEHATRATAPWSLGRWSGVVNVIAIAWVLFIVVVFALPPNELVLWTMLLVAVLLGLYWGLAARHRFAGPRGDANA
jgi:amino acid transporter